jgi:alpha-tubulin suppressor-like RCC1 family protein
MAGRCHTLTVTEAGKVVSFGCNILGRSGGKEPGEVGGLLAGESAAGVAAGEHFSLVVVQSGRVFGWGDGGSGQMGFKTERTHTPISVPLHPLGRPHDTDGVHALRVVAGYQHAAALVVETNAR